MPGRSTVESFRISVTAVCVAAALCLTSEATAQALAIQITETPKK
jgi:hypothetical protein